MKISCQEELIPGASFADKLKSIESYGFDAVELSGAALNDPAQLAERKAALKDSRIVASTICGGHPPELVHPEGARRQASVDALKRHLDLAAEFGAVGPITVPIFNREQRVPDLAPWKTRAEIERELLLVLLSELIPHAQAAGTSILLEPLNRYESNALPQQRDGAEIVRELASPHVRLMADTFHMHIEERDLPATFRAIGDTLGHVHLADNTRQEPGVGSLDFKAIFDALKETGFKGYMAFECSHLSGPADVALPRSVAYLRECLG